MLDVEKLNKLRSMDIDEYRKTRGLGKATSAKERFALELESIDCGKFVREFQFARSIGKQWSAAIAFLDEMILIDIAGSVSNAYRKEECRKYNVATFLGYAVLRYTVDDIERMDIVLTEIEEFVRERRQEPIPDEWRQ